MRKLLIEIAEGIKFISEIINPKRKDQKWVFCFFFLLSIPISLLMYTKFGLLHPKTHTLGYDVFEYIDRISSIGFFVPGSVGVRHPLLAIILSPLALIAIPLKIISGKLILHVIFLYLSFSVISTLSYTVVYKYCSDLLNIRKMRSFLICLLFSVFGHNIYLSYFPESFPVSMFGLLVIVYMTSDCILNKRRVPLASNIIMFCFLSGVTVTNGMKSAIAQLFQTVMPFRQRIILVLKSGLIFLSLYIISIGITFVTYRLYFGRNIIDQTFDYFSFTRGLNELSEFFLEPLMFHHNYSFVGPLTKPFVYNSIFPLITAFVFYGFILFAILRNIKDKIILLLLSMFSFDILIHFICGFGLDESYIFCQHWFFIFPISIALLYYKIRNEKTKTGMDFLLVFFIIAFAWNNYPLLISFLNPFI